MFRRSRWVVLCSLMLTGCVLHSTKPLTDPATEKPDDKLYGHWVARVPILAKTQEMHLFIGKHTTPGNPTAIMELGEVNWHVEDQIINPPRKSYFTVSRIGKSSYLNQLRCDNMKDFTLDDRDSYDRVKGDLWAVILRYHTDGKYLHLWGLGKEADDLLKKLRETRTLDGMGDSYTKESLVPYLRKTNGEELFNCLLATFTKVP